MEQLWRKVLDAALLGVGLVIAFLCIVIVIPFIPFILAHSHFSNKQFQKGYNLFLERMNGGCFFFYNSRRSSIAFAREVVVPALDPSVHIVFVEGSRIDVGADSQYISNMLAAVKERKGFPYLLKIEHEEVLELSVNNQFYSIMAGHKPIGPLLDRINSFFKTGIPR